MLNSTRIAGVARALSGAALLCVVLGASRGSVLAQGVPASGDAGVETREAVPPAAQAAALPAASSMPPPAAPPEDKPSMVVEGSFGKGATIKSSDDKFSLNVRGRIQARGTLTETPDDEKGPVTGFQVRRMRIVFQGNALGPELTYYIQLAFSNLDMESDLRSPLRDAYFTWTIARDASLRVGQMKVPHGRQRVVSSSAQQMVDRSIVTSEFNLDRDVGVQLFSKDLFGLGGRLGYSLALFGGDGRNRIAERFGLLYAARVQVTPMGSFEDQVEADIKRERKPKLAIAGSVAYNQNTNRPRSTFDAPYRGVHFDYLHVGADVLLKWRGLSVSGEYFYRKADKNERRALIDDVPTAQFSRSGWGAFGTIGQMVIGGLEVLVRFGYQKPLKGAEQGVHERYELGGGLSYYFREHNLKLQSDYFYLPTGGFEHGNHEVRLQAQVYY